MARKELKEIVDTSRVGAYAEALDTMRSILLDDGCRRNSIVYSAQRRHDLAGNPIEVVMVGENHEAA